ncbi:4-hydroxybenzoate polyprenyltransferase [Crossiella equi]|uniref:4-hydroxybenzoate polyprenyltransferase n=1 Tax=Crossiella equi TaxID=130796 RepID=A0ABS5APM0_9PSEU|nr:UbiA family prenyltransferase [Crossiella equi]MBP2478490.1 4-hydroxybenzoate polyprenyltransferase [Crossiella equi]
MNDKAGEPTSIADELVSASRVHSPLASVVHFHKSPIRWVRREIEITARMMVNNFLVVVSGTQITLGVAFKNDLTGIDLMKVYLVGWVLSFLYTYVFDAGNQARGGLEDSINKPWRPVPAGLVTEQGLRVRYVVGNLLYAFLAWWFNVLEWALLWQVSMIALNRFQGRWYIISKQITMQAGVVAMFAIAWAAVEPVNSLTWQWIFFAGVPYVFPLIMEDLRDVKGDGVIGRRTPISVFGERPVRIWCAAWTFCLPFIQHFGLYVPSGASMQRILVCDVLVLGTCWLVCYRLLRYREPKRDAITYLVFYLSFFLSLSAMLVLYF